MLDRLWEGQQALPYDAEGQVVVVTLTVDDSAGVVAVDGGNGNTGSTPVPLGHGEAPGAGGHQRTPSGSILGAMFNRSSSPNLAAFLTGGGSPPPPPGDSAGSASGTPSKANGAMAVPGPVSVKLEVQEVTPKPWSLELGRVNNSGAPTLPNQLYDVLRTAQLEHISELILKEGTMRLMSDLRPRWVGLRRLDLSNSQLIAVPEEVDNLPQITALILDNNKLTALCSLVNLRNLRELSADNNQISSLRTDLRECTELRVISLEGNRLTKPVLDMKALAKVHTLRLFGNPIEYLPEMHHAFNLRSLSLVNVRVTSEPKFEVSLGDVSSLISTAFGGGSANKGGKAYAMFFSLIFRHSSCQHLLIATAIAHIAAEDKANCEAIASTEGAIQQLLSMVLSNDVLVVKEASKTLGALAADPALARKLVDAKALQHIQSLLSDSKNAVKICGLQILSNLALASGFIARELFSETLLDRLINLIREGTCREVQIMGLEAMGNLSFEPANRRTVARYARSLLASYALGTSDLSAQLSPRVAIYGSSVPSSPVRDGFKPPKTSVTGSVWGQVTMGKDVGAAEGVHPEVKRMATRALAILGENELMRQAIGRQPMAGRGVRILCMDGGGIRGSATVQMLRRLEEGTGRRIHEMFDIICGTSTGGILAVALGVHKHDLDRCNEIYTDLGTRIFSKSRQADPGESSWRERLDNLYTSGQQTLRVAVRGSKHDASLFEELVRQECRLPTPSDPASKEELPFIDTALLGGPKVFVVSTRISTLPATPFLFRNYQYPEGVDELQAEDDKHPPGSCKHLLWQGVRASSAAPYYLADFSHGEDKFQDGAVTCNNPSMLGVMEARRLWPDRPLECVVSLGSGATPIKPRDMSSISGNSISRMMDAGVVMMESSTSVDRVDESLRTLIPMIPGAKYFRFNPIEERCQVELDDTDPGLLQGLADATEEYIREEDNAFSEACSLLKGALDTGEDESAVAVLATEVGSRRGLLLVEAPRVEEETSSASAAVEEFCSIRSIPFERLNTAGVVAPVAAATGEGKNPGDGAGKAADQSNDVKRKGGGGAASVGVGVSGGGVGIGALLRTAARFSNQMGVIHFGCLSDAAGLVLRWRTEVTAFAEPSRDASEFVDRVRQHPDDPEFSSLHDLCAHYSRVEMDGVLHSVLGKHVHASGSAAEEIGAYLFRRSLPDEYLDAQASAKLLGVWRDKIVVSQAALPRDFIRVLLDAEAKVVVAPSFDDEAGCPVGWGWEHGAVDFFSAFYHALYVVGADAVAALGAAVLVQPTCGHFRCHMRIGGELMTLKAGDDDLLPAE